MGNVRAPPLRYVHASRRAEPLVPSHCVTLLRESRVSTSRVSANALCTKDVLWGSLSFTPTAERQMLQQRVVRDMRSRRGVRGDGAC